LVEFATCGMPRPSTESLMMHVMMNTLNTTIKKMSTGRLRNGRFADLAAVVARADVELLVALGVTRIL
jgi:hypothetical protein